METMQISSNLNHKSNILLNACRSSLKNNSNTPTVSTSAIASEPTQQKKPSEMPKAEILHQYEENVPFNPIPDDLSERYHEIAAIVQYDGGEENKFAERYALSQIAKLKEKQSKLLPQVQKYWQNFFQTSKVLSEFELVNLLLEDDFRDPNPKDNTIMLNKIFDAVWNGYITFEDGPGNNNHRYRLSVEFLSQNQVA